MPSQARQRIGRCSFFRHYSAQTPLPLDVAAAGPGGCSSENPIADPERRVIPWWRAACAVGEIG
ncbi:MAG: hypothetical protein WHU94_16895 [Thermogemmata sp.]